MNTFFKLKERFLVKKTYNIALLRLLLYVCYIVQIFLAIIPLFFSLTASEIMINLIYTFTFSSFAYIFGYFMDVLLFYIIFKKQVNNSFRFAEKQIAPLFFLQMIIPFVLNTVSFFIALPNFNHVISIMQLILTMLYLSYLSWGNIFKEKCVSRIIIYFIAELLFKSISYFLKSGISL